MLRSTLTRYAFIEFHVLFLMLLGNVVGSWVAVLKAAWLQTFHPEDLLLPYTVSHSAHA